MQCFANRQLGHESQAKKDDGHRPHAKFEGDPAQVQERLSDGRAEGESGTGECGECSEIMSVTGLRVGIGVNGRRRKGGQVAGAVARELRKHIDESSYVTSRGLLVIYEW